MKIRNILISCLSLSLIFNLFLSGCIYLTHLDETMFLNNLNSNQQEMNSTIKAEAEVYHKLKKDVVADRLKIGTQKKKIVSIYGEPAICKDAKEGLALKSCFYRNPADYSSGLIYLKFDENDRLYSWNLEKPQYHAE